MESVCVLPFSKTKSAVIDDMSLSRSPKKITELRMSAPASSQTYTRANDGVCRFLGLLFY